MTEEDIAQREQKMRDQFPDMFNHSEAVEGECFLKMVAAGEILEFLVLEFKRGGLQSTRSGKTVMLPGDINGVPGGRGLPFAPLFVNTKEFIEHLAGLEATKGF